MELYKVIFNEETTGVYGISLVAEPATEEMFLTLSKQSEVAIKMATVDQEQRIVLGAVLIPDKPILRKDGDKEFYITFPTETISLAAQNFLKNGYQKNSTLEHDPAKPIEGVSIVESWIKMHQDADKSNAYGLDYPVGTWVAMMKIENANIWENYVKTGVVNGFSIDGSFPLEKINNPNIMLSEIKKVIKEAFAEVKLSAEQPVKMGAIKTADGAMTINYEGDTLAIGISVMSVDSEGTTTPLADGDYTLENGQNISVMGGKVAELSTAQEEAADESMQEMAKEVTKEMATTLKACVDSLQKEFTKQIEAVKVELSKQIEETIEKSIVETEVRLTKTNPEKLLSEMLPHEKHLANRTHFVR